LGMVVSDEIVKVVFERNVIFKDLFEFQGCNQLIEFQLIVFSG
jgi:hypothetical protein